MLRLLLSWDFNLSLFHKLGTFVALSRCKHLQIIPSSECVYENVNTERSHLSRKHLRRSFHNAAAAGKDNRLLVSWSIWRVCHHLAFKPVVMSNTYCVVVLINMDKCLRFTLLTQRVSFAAV